MAGITVASLKSSLQAIIAPGDDASFLRLLTEADLRLLEWGRWAWTHGRADLTPVDNVVTLPINFMAIMGARMDEYPLTVYMESYEFTPGGAGQVDVGGSGGLRLIDQGLDDDGARYYNVVGTATTEDDYTIHTLCHFAPFALYYSDSAPATVTLIDSTITRCPSMAALKNMLLGIIFEEDNDPGTARSYVSDALKILENHEQRARGNAKPVLNIRANGPGVAGIRSFY